MFQLFHKLSSFSLPSTRKTKTTKKVKRNKTPRLPVLFHLFPEGTSFCLLSVPSLVVGSFPPPTKPWRPHLVCGLIRYRLVVKRESLGSDWLTPPFPVPSFNLTQGRRNNVVYKLVPSGYCIDSFKFCKSLLTKAYVFLLVTCPLLPLPLHSRLYHCPSLSSIPSSDAALWKLSRRGLLCSLTLTLSLSLTHLSFLS